VGKGGVGEVCGETKMVDLMGPILGIIEESKICLFQEVRVK